MPCDLGIFRLNQIVLVRRVRSASMAQAEMARRQAQGLAGEKVAGP